MRIFVTGGTGFIGSHFINAAHAAGNKIVALRRSPASRPRIPLDREPIWLDKAMLDVTSEDFDGCEVVIHLAAVGITPQPATWESCYQFNVLDTLAFIEKAVSSNISRFVLTGTYAEYGQAGLRYDRIPPDSPLEPTDIYAASKASAFLGVSALARIQRFQLSYQRLFSVYGDGQYKENFWPQLREAALGGLDFKMTYGTQIRDFIKVEHVADKLVACCFRDLGEANVEIANLASGRAIRLIDFARAEWSRLQASGQLLPGSVPTRPDEIARYVPLV